MQYNEDQRKAVYYLSEQIHGVHRIQSVRLACRQPLTQRSACYDTQCVTDPQRINVHIRAGPYVHNTTTARRIHQPAGLHRHTTRNVSASSATVRCEDALH